MDELEQIQACFQAFIEGSLITHDIEGVLELFTEDVMGIGMGAQGIVRCKEDLRPILLNSRSDVDDSRTAIQYSNLQIRYYGADYAAVCATVTITTEMRGERHKSHIGQCAALRRLEGRGRSTWSRPPPCPLISRRLTPIPSPSPRTRLRPTGCRSSSPV